jgi:hypothetical protein
MALKHFGNRMWRGDHYRKKNNQGLGSLVQGQGARGRSLVRKLGRQSNSVLSAMIHPSFAAGMFSALPLKTKHRPGENWLGVWGDKSDGSVDTIYMYASFMFPVFLLHQNFPFDNFKAHLGSPIVFEESNELHRHIKDGRWILASIILSLGKSSNRKYIFPRYDMSIFKRRKQPLKRPKGLRND